MLLEPVQAGPELVLLEPELVLLELELVLLEPVQVELAQAGPELMLPVEAGLRQMLLELGQEELMKIHFHLCHPRWLLQPQPVSKQQRRHQHIKQHFPVDPTKENQLLGQGPLGGL